MDDAETRAELERIDPEYAEWWDELIMVQRGLPPDSVQEIDILRLLAEKHGALREIGEKTTEIITHPPDPSPTLPIMLANALVAINKIAKNACKEE